MTSKALNMEDTSGVPDLVLLDELSDDAIFGHLSHRYRKGSIYTYIGEVVISVNPYKPLPIYGPKAIAEYEGSVYFQNEPHIYSLAEKMYRSLRNDLQSQCVLISGESGAGKTEASKKIMEYITAVSRAGGAVSRVAGMLLGSNPILEAFGNAKTMRNDNSSRFGKYMEIMFDVDGVPRGGRITNYLLEKVRVVNRSVGERSFHIFYMLLAGANEAMLGQLYLQRDPAAYRYLASSECHAIEGVDDAKQFARIAAAMRVLGFDAATQQAVWKVLAGILLLGNVSFKAEGKDDASTVVDPAALDRICALWHVSRQQLQKALTTRTLATAVGNKQTIRKGGVNTPLSVAEAEVARDALAKAMYSGLFDFVVRTVNEAMKPSDVPQQPQPVVADGSGDEKGADGDAAQAEQSPELSIGILDIYGFEVFDANSFEQFTINWCNEKLQQYFIDLTLREEQAEYHREGISWTDIEYFDNGVIIDLIEKKGATPGIVQLLNECCTLQSVDDAGFLERIKQSLGHHEHLSVNESVKGPRNEFCIKHFAGEVRYSAEGFLQKNRDTLFADQVKLVESSTDETVRQLMRNVEMDQVKKPETAGTKFKKSLNSLIDALKLCRPSYVRCIKPNEEKQPLEVNEQRFRHQIRYLGLLENLRVRRAGFCNRQTYETFLQRYKMTTPATWPHWKGEAREGCLKIVENFQFTEQMFRAGKTKVFIRNPKELFALEKARNTNLPMVATMVQRAYRGHAARVRYEALRAAALIQRSVRARLERDAFHKKQASLTLLSAMQAKLAAGRFAKARQSLQLQSVAKAKLERTKFVERRQAYYEEQGASKVKAALRRLVVRRWLEKVQAVYRDATAANLFGYKFQERWPAVPHAWKAEGEQYLKRMEQRWRYAQMLSGLSEATEALYREKVAAYDLFHNKKVWDPSAPWSHHDHVGTQENMFQQAFQAAASAPPLSEEKVLFSDLVDKANPDGKMVVRCVVLTDKALYRMDPKKFKPDKRDSLADIEKIVLTPYSDHLVVISVKSARDVILNFVEGVGALIDGQETEEGRKRSLSEVGRSRSHSNLRKLRDASNRRSSASLASSAKQQEEEQAELDADGNLKIAASVATSADRYSEFVTLLQLACQEVGNAVEVEFTEAIVVNVSKKVDKKELVTIRPKKNAEVTNSSWLRGKAEHAIFYQ